NDAGILGLSSVGPVKTYLCPRTLYAFGMGINRIITGPAIVGLPGIVRALEQDICRSVIRDDKYDITLPIGILRIGLKRRQPPHIHTGDPVFFDMQTKGRFPLTFMDVLVTRFRHWLLFPLKRPQFFHQPGAFSSIVSGSEYFQAKLADGIRRDHDMQRITGLHALPAAIPLDPGSPL